METWIPEHLRDEQRAVETEIRAAFHSVSRDGGTSWHEAAVNDLMGTDAERAAERARDTERCWEDLVDDPNWQGVDGNWDGQFNFMNEIGWKYYIAPAMIRCLRYKEVGKGEAVAFALKVYNRRMFPGSNRDQDRAIVRFLRFMIAAYDAAGAAGDADFAWSAARHAEPWHVAYESFWRDVEIWRDVESKGGGRPE